MQSYHKKKRKCRFLAILSIQTSPLQTVVETYRLLVTPLTTSPNFISISFFVKIKSYCKETFGGFTQPPPPLGGRGLEVDSFIQKQHLFTKIIKWVTLFFLLLRSSLISQRSPWILVFSTLNFGLYHALVRACSKIALRAIFGFVPQ